MHNLILQFGPGIQDDCNKTKQLSVEVEEGMEKQTYYISSTHMNKTINIASSLAVVKVGKYYIY